MEDKLDIFIGAVGEIEAEITNPCYKIMKLGNTTLSKDYPIEIISDKTGDNISDKNKFICEFTGMYWVWKNYPLKDYVGFCQYRKYFDFLNDIPDIDEIFKEHDIILTTPIGFKSSILTQYTLSHNMGDLLLLKECLRQKFPQYVQDFNSFIGGKRMYACNLFIMKKEDFMKYCNFIWKTITHFMKMSGIKNYEDTVLRVLRDKWYEKKVYPNNTIDYQARFMAYLIERLTNIYVMHNFKKPYLNHKLMEMSVKYKE